MAGKEVQEEGFIKWFSELSGKDIDIVGEKGARLADMHKNKLPVPPGFIITVQAYQNFIQKTGLGVTIKVLVDRLDISDEKKLQEASDKIRSLIESSELPNEIVSEIMEAYDILGVSRQEEQKGALDVLSNRTQPLVAVRTSLSRELSDESLTGYQESFLGVKSENLLSTIKKCMSSIFTPKSLRTLVQKNFHFSSGLAVIVQRMVNAEKSGVVFSGVPVKNKEAVSISAVFGLSDGDISKKIAPDKYVVHNEDILTMKISDKKSAAVRTDSSIKEVKLKPEQSLEPVLSRYEIKRLAQYAMQLEEHYKEPQDIEFAISHNEIYLVQSRPLSLRSKDTSFSDVVLEEAINEEVKSEVSSNEKNSDVQPTEKVVSPAVSYGPVKKSQEHLTSMEEEVLKALDDDYSPGMERADDVPVLNDAIPVDSDHFN